MKVLDLQCSAGHDFEGWFASEEDFVSQRQRCLVQCPVCADPEVVKKLSAPRLNLSGAKPPVSATEGPSSTSIAASSIATEPQTDMTSAHVQRALQQVWMEVSRHIVANTDDVGTQFAEEARRMHYGEVQERAIRGQATVGQTRELLEEGIDILPLRMPEHLKKTLQ